MLKRLLIENFSEFSNLQLINGADEYSSDDGLGMLSSQKKFKLPKRLRGCHFLERVSIPFKEHSGILNQTGGHEY